MTQDLQAISRQIKKSILEQDKLDQVVENLKEDIEDDIEGRKVDLSAWQDFMRDRNAIQIGVAKSVENDLGKIPELRKKKQKFEDRDDFEEIKKEYVREDFQRYAEVLKELAERNNRLYSTFGLMWYGDSRVVSKQEELIDTQENLRKANDFTDKLQDLFETQKDLGEQIASGIARAQFEDLKEEMQDELREEFQEIILDDEQVKENAEEAVEEIVEEQVREKVRQETPEPKDLEALITESEITSRRDLGVILAENTELSNSQIAGICGVKEPTVSGWT